jgi:hypothetical protein
VHPESHTHTSVLCPTTSVDDVVLAETIPHSKRIREFLLAIRELFANSTNHVIDIAMSKRLNASSTSILQSRLLPTISPNLHQIALLMREADFFLFPEADLLAISFQPVTKRVSKTRPQNQKTPRPRCKTYSSLSTLGSITTLSVLRSAVQQ